MENIRINTSSPYNVIISNDILKNALNFIEPVVKAEKILVVCDDIVARLYLDTIKTSLENKYEISEFIFAHGEVSKNPKTLEKLLNFLCEKSFSRADAIIALGGGVCGDLTGLAAALYMRGIDFIQVPTTLLAMVDSSVGGKTAVNLKKGKNMMGAFYQPRLVLCDVNTLTTLPPEVYSEGMAEVIKYGGICNDNLLNKLKENYDICEIVKICVDIKNKIVTEDEYERGSRKLLNFGHTLGHAVEELSDYKIFHGNAVSIGMLLITNACVHMNICNKAVYDELKDLLKKFNLPCECNFTAKQLFNTAMSDKKKTGEYITLIIPQKRAECILKKMDIDEFKKFVELSVV